MTSEKASVKYTLRLMYINRVITDGLSQYKYKYITFMRIYSSITLHSHYSFVLDHVKLSGYFEIHG